MTQTSAVPGDATPDTGPVFPPGRYGRRREATRRRWAVPLLLLVVVALMGLIAVKLFSQYGTAQYTPTVLALKNVTNSSIAVTFRVQKPTNPAVCTVDAEARDGSIVGTSNVPVPAGTTVTVTYTVTTSQRAHIAEVPSCHAAN